MRDATEKCWRCRFSVDWFYRPPDQPIGRGTTIKCRRRAPIITGGMMSQTMTVWPAVEREDWCGEFEPRQIDPTTIKEDADGRE